MNLHLSYPQYLVHQRQMPSDYEGRVITSLIESRANTASALTVLYIHGFSDYFFQTHVMDFYNRAGIDFYALDLRKYGRSLLENQHPNYCRSMREYFPDLEFAIQFIQKKNPQAQLVFLGHSTGGLLASYYARVGLLRKQIVGLILNSPFLEFNKPRVMRWVLPFLSDKISQYKPFASVQGGVSETYPKSLLKRFYGEWEFKEEWKPLGSFPAFFAWISAVAQAQKVLKQTTSFEIPILLMYSKTSSAAPVGSALAQVSDTVLQIADIKRIGMKLGSRVTAVEVPDGMHDLFLSRKDVRNFALQATLEWLKTRLIDESQFEYTVEKSF